MPKLIFDNFSNFIIYFDLQGRRQAFDIQTRNMNLSETVDLEHLAEVTNGCSGADIMGICAEVCTYFIIESDLI